MFHPFFAFVAALLIGLEALAFGSSSENQSEQAFLLPVTEKSDLSVSVPKGYKSLTPPADWAKAPIIEFIPEGESDTNWTEIVTVSKFSGAALPADRVTDLIGRSIGLKAKNVETWMDEKEEAEDVKTALLGLTYDYEGKREVLGMKYLSGPLDCSGVQCTIRVKGKEEELAAIEKVRKFLSEQRILSSFHKN